MYNDYKLICHCMKVSYKTVKDAIKEGATTVSEITEETNAGLACGVCIERIEELLAELQK